MRPKMKKVDEVEIAHINEPITKMVTRIKYICFTFRYV